MITLRKAVQMYLLLTMARLCLQDAVEAATVPKQVTGLLDKTPS